MVSKPDVVDSIPIFNRIGLPELFPMVVENESDTRICIVDKHVQSTTLIILYRFKQLEDFSIIGMIDWKYVHGILREKATKKRLNGGTSQWYSISCSSGLDFICALL